MKNQLLSALTSYISAHYGATLIEDSLKIQQCCYHPAASIAFSNRLLLNAAADALKGQELKKDNSFIDSLNAYTKQAAQQHHMKKQFEKEQKKKQEEEQAALKETKRELEIMIEAKALKDRKNARASQMQN